MDQWWITGFVPNIYDYSIKAEELLQIASVDFSSQPIIYNDLKTRYEFDKDYISIIIFDDQSQTIYHIKKRAVRLLAFLLIPY